VTLARPLLASVTRPTPHGVLGPSVRAAVIGLSGTGKSRFAKALIRTAGRVVIFDLCNEYRDVAVTVTIGELLEAPELLLGDPVALAVTPSSEDEDEIAEDLERLVALVRRAGNAVLVLEEVGDYGARAASTISRLARNGRHQGIATVFVTQAAVEIPKAARRQLTHVFSFLQTDPEDLAALAKRCGEPFAARVTSWRVGDPPAAWILPSLAPHHPESSP
jgi:hypothetical protein